MRITVQTVNMLVLISKADWLCYNIITKKTE